MKNQLKQFVAAEEQLHDALEEELDGVMMDQMKSLQTQLELEDEKIAYNRSQILTLQKIQQQKVSALKFQTKKHKGWSKRQLEEQK